MQFSLTSTIAIVAAITTSSSAFVLDTYSDLNCGSVVQTGVNVWDNTCATWPNGFRSFRITVWGGNHQRAYFFAPDNCGSIPGAINQGYVDSTTRDFTLNRCYTVGGSSANAIASYYTV